jgi:transcriptional regulator with XRE-family HTH domain
MKAKDLNNALRIKEIMEYFHLNQTEFAERTGIPKSNLSKILGGSLACGPGTMNKVVLAFTNLNKDWILYGVGEMLVNTTPTINQTNINGDNNYVIGKNATRPNMPAIIEVKENGVEVECPNCGEVIEVTSTAVIPLVPPEVAKRPDINLENFRHNCPQQMEEVDLRQVWGKGVFLMKVDTRAMEPEYREGTFLVLRRLKDLSYARPDGSAYVIDTMRPHTLFRYLSKERDGTYILSAESDKRGPIYLNAEDIINIYDVVGSFRIGR